MKRFQEQIEIIAKAKSAARTRHPLKTKRKERRMNLTLSAAIRVNPWLKAAKGG
jgi:hypothetical protein